MNMKDLDHPSQNKDGHYTQALKHCIPVRCHKRKDNEIPMKYAGCFSYMTVSWLGNIVWKIYKNGIDSVTLWKCSENESSFHNLMRLENLWNEEINKKGPAASFKNVFIQFVKTRMILASVFLIISLACSLFTPFYLIHQLLDYMSSENKVLMEGILLVISLLISELIRSLSFATMWSMNYTTGVRVKVAATALLYKKIMLVKSMKEKTAGELINMCTLDGQRFCDATVLAPLAVGSPFVLVCGVIYNIFLLGPFSLIGAAVFIGFYPLVLLLMKLAAYYRKKIAETTDQRVNIMNELFSCICLVKMYAWELSFTKIIQDIRKLEKQLLTKTAFVQTVNVVIPPMVPIIAGVVTFLSYILTKNDLTAAQAFTMIAVLNSMRFALGSLPYCFKALSDASVSIKRYQEVLSLDQIEDIEKSNLKDEEMVVFENASLSWNCTAKKEEMSTDNKEMKCNNRGEKLTENMKLLPSSQEAILTNISFVLKKGQMLGVCGSIGSGKSSLISAILGRMNLVSGKISKQGIVAYVPQQAWIMNASAQENILFGLPFDEERYDQIVEACCLKEDFNLIGDDTEIGERGMNLSGGQKQRIGLARAVYSDRDIYLLDDPLSAVDVHIGKHIFDRCINTFLKEKTVIFVTHQLQYLESCDHILFLKDGKISEQGSHQSLMADHLEYCALIESFYEDSNLEEKKKTECMTPLSPSPSLHPRFQFNRTQSVISRRISASQLSLNESILDNADLVQEEESSTNVGLPELWFYMKACGGFFICIFALLMFAVSIAVQTSSAWWLTYWIQQNDTDNIDNKNTSSVRISSHPQVNLFATVYGLTVLVTILVHLIRGYIYVKTTIKGANWCHNQLLQKVIWFPMEFFDCNPVGRILNRFSSDMDEVDSRLASLMEMFFMNILSLLAANISMIIVVPWMSVVSIPLMIAFVLLSRIFATSLREIKKKDNVTRSPLISLISATMHGLSTIFAYKKNQLFIDRYCQIQDENTVPFFLFYMMNRWVAIRLDFICILICFSCALSIVLLADVMPAALAGLGLSFALQVTNLSQYTVRLWIELEARFDSIKRIKEYVDKNESEADSKTSPEYALSADWPTSGHIQFNEYSMKYRSNLPNALKKICLDISPSQKLGIVGRSGSGKSSLGAALFRLVEPSDGNIIIDGYDITKVGLQDLRSRISIIPQDPILFRGTIRYNLDPLQNCNDFELWEALEKCHIKNRVESLEGQLNSFIEENGENFSVGERQLFCLARALLRKCKILILDEATASIDTETDHLIQKTLQNSFSHCTMLVIAHRLNTVIDCSRIIVMENGKIAEYGKPTVLISMKNSKFRAMWEASETKKTKS